MFKSVLKEIGVSLLLFIAVVLVLSIIFYDYNPINKIIPNRVAYSTPESVQNEVSEEVTELDEKSLTYTIDGSDLEKYKKDKSYIAGKTNPFLVEETDEDEDKTNEVDDKKTNTTEKDKTNTTDKDKTNTTDKTNTSNKNNKTNSTTNDKTNTDDEENKDNEEDKKNTEDKNNEEDKKNTTTEDKTNTNNSSKNNTTNTNTQQGLWGNTGKK